MAEAYGKLTGKPGICFVTRGPGATNASIGVHTAFQDSTPMILLHRPGRNRSSTAKRSRKSISARCSRRSPNGSPKSAIPIAFLNTSHAPFTRPYRVDQGRSCCLCPKIFCSRRCTAPADEALCEKRTARQRAKTSRNSPVCTPAQHRPFLILGGPGWEARAIADTRKFAEDLDLPVCTAFRAKDRFDNTHRNYCGDLGIGADPKLVARLEDSDLLIVVGARLGEMTTDGYTRVEGARAEADLMHVHPGADELGKRLSG